MQKKISLIIATDFCCWMPIAVMTICSISGINIAILHSTEQYTKPYIFIRIGIEIPKSMYALTTMCILPINSVLNPLIYSNLPEKSYQLLIKPMLNKLNPPQSEATAQVIELRACPNK